MDDTTTRGPNPVYSDKVGKKRRAIIVIAILAVIVIIQGVKMYVDHRKLETSKENLAGSEAELNATIQKLHKIQADLDRSIAETKKLGGDIADLEKAKISVEADLRNTRRRTGRNIQQLKEKVSGYEQLLKLKDKELEKLKSMNEELYSENKTLKTEQNKLSDSIVQLSKDTDNLASKVAIASQLKAENIAVTALNSRDREIKHPFRSKRIQQLRITFNLAENKVAPIEGKKILIRIVDQNDQVIFDVASGSGTFMQEGKEEFYTASQEILFDNTLQKMVFFYEKSSRYAAGSYRVEVFTDDYSMGSATFSVR